MGTKLLLYSSIVFASVAGCAGTWSSGRPIYPEDWPALRETAECPDLSGTYRAISDEAGPLRYRSGEHPREHFSFVTYGKPEPLPPLGRRILTWHLGAAFDGEVWDALHRYAAVLDTAHPEADAGWVRVMPMPDGSIGIRAGRAGRSLLDFTIRKEEHRWGKYTSAVYQCEDGALVVTGAFPPPPEENPADRPGNAGAKFRFYRAADGSIVAVENKFADVSEGNLSFQKWWRWRRID